MKAPKRTFIITGLSLAVAAGSVAYGATAPAVDFKAVNPVIQSLVDAVIAADDTVDFALPKFDEKVSNLKENRLKYDAKGSIKNTPWLDGGTANVAGSATFEVDSSETHDGVAPIWGDHRPTHYSFTEASARVETDTLAFVRYWADLALRRIDHYDPKYEERIKAHLKRAAVATSLDEFYGILYSLKQLGLEPMKDELEKYKKQLECYESFPCFKSTYGNWYPGATDAQLEEKRKEWAKSKRDNVDNLTKGIDAYNQVQLNPIKTQNRVTSIQIIVDEKVFSAAPQPANKPTQAKPRLASVTFTEEAISSKVQAWGEISQNDFVRLKGDLNKALVELQEGNTDQKKKTEDGFRKGLIAFKKAIKGQPQ